MPQYQNSSDVCALTVVVATIAATNAVCVSYTPQPDPLVMYGDQTMDCAFCLVYASVFRSDPWDCVRPFGKRQGNNKNVMPEVPGLQCNADGFSKKNCKGSCLSHRLSYTLSEHVPHRAASLKGLHGTWTRG